MTARAMITTKISPREHRWACAVSVALLVLIVTLHFLLDPWY